VPRMGMGRRAGRPGLIGTVARTAVVAGTATAVAGGVHRHEESKSAEQQQAADAQQQAAAQQAPAQQAPAQQAPAQQAPAQQAPAQQAPAQRAPMDESDRLARIKELGQMRDQGLLTDSEFTAEKARLLST
jgi:Short C-terminal domain